jgi:hypothetical protein
MWQVSTCLRQIVTRDGVAYKKRHAENSKFMFINNLSRNLKLYIWNDGLSDVVCGPFQILSASDFGRR